MFYLSPTLTVMMLGIVPPVSLGAVSMSSFYDSKYLICLQVFYGRYLKKLSNQTQEAMGEMTKVGSRISVPSPVHILNIP